MSNHRKQRVHGLPDEDFWAIMRGDAEIAIVPFGLEKEADEIVAALNTAPALLAELQRLHAKHGEAATEAVITKATEPTKGQPK